MLHFGLSVELVCEILHFLDLVSSLILWVVPAKQSNVSNCLDFASLMNISSNVVNSTWRFHNVLPNQIKIWSFNRLQLLLRFWLVFLLLGILFLFLLTTIFILFHLFLQLFKKLFFLFTNGKVQIPFSGVVNYLLLLLIYDFFQRYFLGFHVFVYLHDFSAYEVIVTYIHSLLWRMSCRSSLTTASTVRKTMMGTFAPNQSRHSYLILPLVLLVVFGFASKVLERSWAFDI